MAKEKCYLIGLDIGTTGTKAMLLSSDGKKIAEAYKQYETYHPQKSYNEQNPNDWWDATVETVRDVCKNIEPSDVAAVSLSTQGGTVFAADKNLNPLKNAIVWSDLRCTEEKKEFIDSFGSGDYIYSKTGWGLDPGLPALQIRKLLKENPELRSKDVRFVTVPDYITEKMTGIAAADISNSGINQLCNINDGEYDSKLLEFAGIDKSQLPAIVPSSVKIANLSEKAAAELGLTTATAFVSGAHDQYAVAVGGGAIHSGDIMIGSGTSWVVTSISDKSGFDTGFAISKSAVPGKWGAITAISSGGICLEWFRNQVLAESGEKLSYKVIDDESAKRKASENGLFFYPFANPIMQNGKNSCGTFMGLASSDDAFSMARAIMEGVSYTVALMLEKFNTKATSIVLAGGAAKSSIWPQLLADATGTTIAVPEESNLACVGAAIIAGVGSGVYTDFESGCRAMNVKYNYVAPKCDCSSVLEKYRNGTEIIKKFYEI